ncbi:MAG: type II toxin-antitoxin system PemK/MazF family toxin [Phormidesmis sp. CAN_BIN44]|nr:type II toxin-antitoxin system PemK/MazF family toxin [Phormidesmis sp. CAN_BIN44]
MIRNEPHRGEVRRVQFNPTRGDEIQKTRPAIVVSADGLTKLQLRLVVPLTGWKPSFTNLTWLVQIDPSTENGLIKVSAANPLQTRSVSLDRFVERLGRVDGRC